MRPRKYGILIDRNLTHTPVFPIINDALTILSPINTIFLLFDLIADAFDHDLMFNCLKDIQEAKPTKVPVYDFKTNSRK